LTSKSTEAYKPTRESLLHDLEDIKSSLLEDGDFSAEGEAPVVSEASRSDFPPDAKDDFELIDEEARPAKHVLPGQQSLFDEQAAENHLEHSEAHTEKGENPFLPQHIRERLSKNKASMMEDLAHVGETLSRHKKDKQEAATEAQHQLIDELVAKYLPEIEKELRERLHQSLQKIQHS